MNVSMPADTSTGVIKIHYTLSELEFATHSQTERAYLNLFFRSCSTQVGNLMEQSRHTGTQRLQRTPRRPLPDGPICLVETGQRDEVATPDPVDLTTCSELDAADEPSPQNVVVAMVLAVQQTSTPFYDVLGAAVRSCNCPAAHQVVSGSRFGNLRTRRCSPFHANYQAVTGSYFYANYRPRCMPNGPEKTPGPRNQVAAGVCALYVLYEPGLSYIYIYSSLLNMIELHHEARTEACLEARHKRGLSLVVHCREQPAQPRARPCWKC
jgi:hypothetical protein